MGFPIDNTPKSGSIRPPKCGDLHPPQLAGLDWAVLAMIRGELRLPTACTGG